MGAVSVKKRIGAEVGLLFCALFWGGGFVFMKNALDVWPVSWLLSVRFVLAGLILLPFVWKDIRPLGRAGLLGSVWAGGLVFFAYYAQTVGLSMTNAGNNAFITAFYVVLVPLLQWGLRRIYPGNHSIMAALLSLSGIGLIAVGPDFRVGAGDLWTLLCGVLFGVHVVLVSHYTDRNMPMMPFSVLQILATGVLAGVFALLTEPLPPAGALLTGAVVFPMLYLVLAATAFAFVMQNVALKFAVPGHAVLLMSMEAPFGCLFGVLFLDEKISLRFLLGAAMILGAIVWSETVQSRATAKP